MSVYTEPAGCGEQSKARSAHRPGAATCPPPTPNPWDAEAWRELSGTDQPHPPLHSVPLRLWQTVNFK